MSGSHFLKLIFIVIYTFGICLPVNAEFVAENADKIIQQGLSQGKVVSISMRNMLVLKSGAKLLVEKVETGTLQFSPFEKSRIADEYQLALNNNPFGNSQYRIKSTVSEGDVLIDLRIFPVQIIHVTKIQCRTFFEQTSVNGDVRTNKIRSACREIPGKWILTDNTYQVG